MKQIESAERQRQLSLLLVDDDVELCGMMREFFTQEGHSLECAYNGREGLTAALNGSYDLIILDVMLPILDGFELLQRLRRRKDLPIIMLTARVQQQDRLSRTEVDRRTRRHVADNKGGTAGTASNGTAAKPRVKRSTHHEHRNRTQPDFLRRAAHV